jgi:hypothetical protein
VLGLVSVPPHAARTATIRQAKTILIAAKVAGQHAGRQGFARRRWVEGLAGARAYSSRRIFVAFSIASPKLTLCGARPGLHITT